MLPVEGQSPEVVENHDSVVDEQPIPEVEVTAAPGGDTPAEEPAYTPNFKFKVLDQEKEIDDWARPFVNKDTEGKFKEIFEKSSALDHVKGKRDEYQTQVQTLGSQLKQWEQEIQEIRGLADQDFGAFLKTCNIDPKHALQWFIQQAEKQELLQRDDLPAWAKEMYNKNEEQSARLRELETANRGNTARAEAAVVSQREQELVSELNRPDIASIVTEVDTRLAKPGSFADMVKRHGYATYHSSQGKTDLSAAQAVAEVLQFLGRTPVQAATQGQANPTPNASPASPKVITATPKATVIPNVGAGTSTATVKKPKSTDDLRKLAKEMAQ